MQFVLNPAYVTQLSVMQVYGFQLACLFVDTCYRVLLM